MPSPDLQRVIQSLVDRWIASPPNDPVLVKAVRASGAMPVYADMGGTLFLRPDGEILFLDDVSSDAPQIETNPGWRITAVVVGAEKHPELGRLLPARPPGIGNCEDCEGHARVRIGDIDYYFLCGTCHGLGWLGGTV
jgi:hypothetical protein